VEVLWEGRNICSVVKSVKPSHFFSPISHNLLSVNCWPSPSNDGSCEVNIEYELENDSLSLYDVTISIPLP
jgi:hypothetical protein